MQCILREYSALLPLKNLAIDRELSVHKICHFQRVKMTVLCIGNLALPTESNITHGNAVGPLTCAPITSAPCSSSFFVCLQYVRRGANFAASQSVLGYAQ